MKLRSILTAVTLTFAVSACGEEPTTPANTIATVEISDLYLKAPSAGRDITGGGMKITATNGDFRLVSASSDAADRVELHTMEMDGDMMKMRQADGFDIAAGETFILEPGGPHLMLFGVDAGLESGDTAEMLFTFQDPDGESVTLNYAAQIKGAGSH